MLACVLGGIYTEVEKTLIELQRTPLVHEMRSAFQMAMEERFIARGGTALGPPGASLPVQPTASDPMSRSRSSFSAPLTSASVNRSRRASATGCIPRDAQRRLTSELFAHRQQSRSQDE